jgi:hypothetical protein
MSNEFKNEAFSSYDPHPVPACHHCGEKPALALQLLFRFEVGSLSDRLMSSTPE